MNKLATLRYDVVDELSSGDTTLIIGVMDSMDDSIKEAHVPTDEEQQELGKHDVALVLRIPGVGSFNKFAHISKDLSELNAKLLAAKADSLPDEICKTASYYLKKASKRWGFDFPEDLEQYVGEIPNNGNIVNTDEIDKVAWAKKRRNNSLMQKNAGLEASSDFALPKEKRWRLDSPEYVKTANSYFDNNYIELELGDRLEFAMNLAKAVDAQEVKEDGVKIAGLFNKYSDLIADEFNENFGKHINIRKSYAPVEHEVQGLYDKLIEKKAEFGPIKIAALLERLDEEWGGRKFYNTRIEDPLIATLKTEKIAEAIVDGQLVTSADLQKLSEKDISAYVDKDTAEDLSGPEGLDVLKSLPLPTRSGLLSEL